MNYLPRPHLVERLDYQPDAPQEEFMVPLLRLNIERGLRNYAIPPLSNACALDIGCGRQPFRRTLESIGYSYKGLDAQQNPEGTVDFVCAFDEQLPNELKSHRPFEFVLCTEVLEHIVDWDTAFKNLAMLTSPSGRILITCPHFYQLHEEPYDFWRPTIHALEYFATRTGFRVLYQNTLGDAWDVLGTLLANCSPKPSGRRLLDKAAARLFGVCQGGVFRLLRSRRLQGAIRLDGPLYLSNIAVLERQ